MILGLFFSFSFSSPFVSFHKEEKEQRGKNNPPTKQFQIDRKSIHLASQKINGKAPGPQKKETHSFSEKQSEK